ncbi:hypothetical protein F1880_006531 [Penicillium rolfsii]|nr:hypothetical protein F1880_006531 [Penicillium rolfsii]
MEHEAQEPQRIVSPPVGKQYRPARRRPAHLRTKTGCLTFTDIGLGLNRKKKCDERRIECWNCVKLHLECVWRSDGATHRQPQARSPSASESVCSGLSTAKNALEDRQKVQQYDSFHQPAELSENVGDDATSEALLFSADVLKKGEGDLQTNRILLPMQSLHGVSLQVDLPASPANNRRSRPLFQFLLSTFLPQLIRPTADGQMCEELNRRSLALAFEHPFCMHALLACCGAEIPGENPEYRELGQYHYTHAVNGLRNILNAGSPREQWIVTMFGIMMLCIYERTKQTPSPGVAIHIAGAARLMRLQSQTHGDSVERFGIDHVMHRLVRESFIFHVTTSLPFQGDAISHDTTLATTSAYQYEIESALSLAEDAISDHFNNDIFSQPTSPVLGFPPQLFRVIYTVYRLYQSSNFDQVSMQLCRRLDKDLSRWDKRLEGSAAESFGPGSSAQKGHDGFDSTSDSTSAQPSSQILRESKLIGPKLYIIGCRILLRRMKGVSLTSEEVSAEELTHQGMSIVLRLQPKKDYYADYYCWPFLAIGTNLRSPTDQEILLAKALAFWKATNNPTMRRLIDMLPGFWQSGD